MEALARAEVFASLSTDLQGWVPLQPAQRQELLATAAPPAHLRIVGQRARHPDSNPTRAGVQQLHRRWPRGTRCLLADRYQRDDVVDPRGGSGRATLAQAPCHLICGELEGCPLCEGAPWLNELGFDHVGVKESGPNNARHIWIALKTAAVAETGSEFAQFAAQLRPSLDASPFTPPHCLACVRRYRPTASMRSWSPQRGQTSCASSARSSSTREPNYSPSSPRTAGPSTTAAVPHTTGTKRPRASCTTQGRWLMCGILN